jgi:hypothetical protein
MKTKFLILFIALIALSRIVSAQLPDYFNGITLDDVRNLTVEQRTALENLPAKTIVRVVFDADTTPDKYISALDYLRSLKLDDGETRKIYIMGELLDSDYLARYRWDCKASEGCTIGEDGNNFHDYKTRIDSYLNSELNEKVDIWEVGNEINGEWADEGCIKKSDGGCVSDIKEEKDASGKKTKSVPQPKITARKIAYAVNAVKDKPIAVTFIHQPECTTWNDYTMSDWLRVSNLKTLIDDKKIDYLLISYYEDNCDKGKKTIASEDDLTPVEKRTLSDKQEEQQRREIYWNKTFNDFEKFFSNVSYIGFGEVGYSSELKTCAGNNRELLLCKKGNLTKYKKLDLMNRYYGMKIENSKYIGGHFWWTAQEDIIYKGFYMTLVTFFK